MRARSTGAALLFALLLGLAACTAGNPAYRGAETSGADAALLASLDAALPPEVDAAPDLAAPEVLVDVAPEPPDVAPDRAPGMALLIVGDPDLSRNDEQLESSLRGLGFNVRIELDTQAETADADDSTLVIISGSTLPQIVGNKFRNVPVPVLVFDEELFPKMGMTGAQKGVDYGITTDQRRIDILDSEHPLSAGLMGTVPVAAQNILLSWGVPGPAAAMVASLVGRPDRITVFGYPAGAEMIGMKAPARRVGSFVRFARNTTYTEEGLSLFEAAVKWATVDPLR
jgi:hypothetical protein